MPVRSKGRHNLFVITSITVDWSVKEKIKAMSYGLFFYYNLAINLHSRSASDTWRGAVNFPLIFKNWFSRRKFKWCCDIMYMEFYSFGHTTSSEYICRDWFALSYPLFFLLSYLIECWIWDNWMLDRSCSGLSLISKKCRRNFHYWNTFMHIARKRSKLLRKA